MADDATSQITALSGGSIRLSGLVISTGINPPRRSGQQLVRKTQQHFQSGIAEVVMDEAPALLARDQPAFAQATQMVRGIGLRQAGARDNLPDR